MNDCFQPLGMLGYEKIGTTRLKIGIKLKKKKNNNKKNTYLPGMRTHNILPEWALSGLWKISRMVTKTHFFLKYIPA